MPATNESGSTLDYLIHRVTKLLEKDNNFVFILKKQTVKEVIYIVTSGSQQYL